jgi:bacillolysin
MIRIFVLILLWFGVIFGAYGQFKPHLKPTETPIPATIQPLYWPQSVPIAAPHAFLHGHANYPSMGPLARPILDGSVEVVCDAVTGLPIWIKGAFKSLQNGKPLAENALAYLAKVQEIMKIRNAEQEFVITDIQTDDLGQTHLRAQQIYQGIRLYGAEVMLHAWDSNIQMVNGRHRPTPRLQDVQPRITEIQATQIALRQISKITRVKQLSFDEQRLVAGKQADCQLIIYYPDETKDVPRLAWQITAHPNVLHRWLYIIDAKNGDILQYHSLICRVHDGIHTHEPIPVKNSDSPLPPRTATARDLFNVNRTINTWQEGTNYFLIDASRPMFNAGRSTMPNEPAGAIWTIDGQNGSPTRDNFSATQLTSNNNTWNNPTAVSAHYNAGRAYEYFRQTFNRNSINGQGGAIISLINIAEEDGSAMDNAFWNGAAMFYGNGNRAFNAPLAKALDVAGHEMSHGVIQNTANLEYRNESGAINESFADIFGAMIDRDDWLIGEDVVNPQVFRSGALRDMSNPNNGGTRFGDISWQPAHVSEQYRGQEDNGGVHINSGIPNRAYYLFATQVGKDVAEQIYYRALTTYLVRSSQFVDLRLAVLQAAADRHGNNSSQVNAAANAFNAVGILGASGNNPQQDVNTNPGQQYLLYANANTSNLNLITASGAVVVSPLSNVGTLSKPSITDDGSAVIYVAKNKTLRGIILRWNQGTYEEIVVSSQPIWRNAAISKDGTKIAALSDNLNNKIYIFDLVRNMSQEFTLSNPTYAQGVSTGNVVFADALEWDFTGEWLMYDAKNHIRSNFRDIEYWDIGFLRVWNKNANNFGDGFIGKLFSGLPDGVSVGNPTFSKNSPYVIAFDYLDEIDEEYYLLGANIETGDVGVIYQNLDLGYPNYAIDDSKVIFDGFSGANLNRVLGVVNMAADKISAQTNPPSATIFITGGAGGARWGTWFANGTRVLTSDKSAINWTQNIEVFPNPFTEILYFRGETLSSTMLRIDVLDALGRLLHTQQIEVGAGSWQERLPMQQYAPGAYVVRVSTSGGSVTYKVIKKR